MVALLIADWFASTISFAGELFGNGRGDPAYCPLQIVCRSVVIYLAGTIIVRLGKSRMIGRVASLDILLGFIMGSLLSRGITGHASLLATILALATLAAVHWLLTWAACHCHWHWFGTVFKGQRLVLTRDAQLVPENLLHSHVSEHELAEELRLRGVADFHDVLLASKERNGQISVIKSRS